MIPVTKPYLPPAEEYNKYLEGIWKRQWLTNNGPLVNELELKIAEFLGMKNFLYLSNGTIALQIAIKALGLKGEVITTPFSYVATTSSLVWEGCKPVFVDIDPRTWNIDRKKIEEAITPNTSAILATHVFGNPCDVIKISEIANKHNLPVIYDGAHAFGVKFLGKSLFEYGDISTVSFHATKLFHTIEGGGVFSNNKDLFKKMGFMRNFGHDGPEVFREVGINGKNSEFHAAMGLANIKKVDEIIAKRKILSELYDLKLTDLGFEKQKISKETTFNYSYYPILLDNEEATLLCLSRLNKSQIFPRRYFYPSLTQIPYLESDSLPISENISKRVLCLPIYYELSVEEVDLICRIIKSFLTNA
ncbi:MAG: DegT/DnrJ/EryC1/StrS family aminotransferase [Algoriphagus sp.]|uniref:DegT/DnrJ/EryC1/StrS family aminotransferase n=1 Tax=Algoriphagus sp. TaxID=1872435 RepID=UPI00261A70BA|nr:DegT/DnrJ/EryC1/StrS family aminotransferase [Algoriphagus sp.]MDG1279252.1 DegT/DnrJ/EryC1/StrS family aminotransferase [Algoriphagus sp.]